MKKVCLVTGAKKGIGLAVSQKLVNAGYCIIMADCESISTKISDNISVFKADISKEKEFV